MRLVFFVESFTQGFILIFQLFELIENIVAAGAAFERMYEHGDKCNYGQNISGRDHRIIAVGGWGLFDNQVKHQQHGNHDADGYFLPFPHRDASLFLKLCRVIPFQRTIIVFMGCSKIFFIIKFFITCVFYVLYS